MWDAILDETDTIVERAAYEVELLTGVTIEEGAKQALQTWGRENRDQLTRALEQGFSLEQLQGVAIEILSDAATKQLGPGEGTVPPRVDSIAAQRSMKAKCPFYAFGCP